MSNFGIVEMTAFDAIATTVVVAVVAFVIFEIVMMEWRGRKP